VHFCNRGVGDPNLPLGHERHRAPRSGLGRRWWISSGFVAPTTHMGPPLTESPGQCRVHERSRTGSLKRQTQPCGAWNACSKGWREQRCGIGCRRRARRPWRASGAPSVGTPARPVVHALRTILRATASRAMTVPVQRPELGGQVTTATPFAPSGAEPGRLSGICSGLAGGP